MSNIHKGKLDIEKIDKQYESIFDMKPKEIKDIEHKT
jgi:hypothetical protein